MTILTQIAILEHKLYGMKTFEFKILHPRVKRNAIIGVTSRPMQLMSTDTTSFHLYAVGCSTGVRSEAHFTTKDSVTQSDINKLVDSLPGSDLVRVYGSQYEYNSSIHTNFV